MPTYEYRCRACAHEFERFQKISDAPVRTCPACKKRRVERLISSGGGLVFKGPGFYATDYRKGAPGAGGKGAGAEGGGASDDKPGDAKGARPGEAGSKGGEAAEKKGTERGGGASAS